MREQEEEGERRQGTVFSCDAFLISFSLQCQKQPKQEGFTAFRVSKDLVHHIGRAVGADQSTPWLMGALGVNACTLAFLQPQGDLSL